MWRLGIVALGFSTALGLGLAGGMNLHRLVDSDQATTWLQQTGSTLQSGFEAARHGIGSKIASFASSPTSVSETTERVARQEPNSGEAVARMVGDLNRQMDQVRTANEGTARDLSQGIEGLRGSTEEHQRELVAKLAQLAERVERVERQPAVAATPVKTQPVVQPTPSSPPSKEKTRDTHRRRHGCAGGTTGPYCGRSRRHHPRHRPDSGHYAVGRPVGRGHQQGRDHGT